MIFPAVLFLLFILFLCIPVHAVLEWDSTKRPPVRLGLVWLFGLVRFTTGGGKRAKTERPGEKKAGRRSGPRTILQFFSREGLFGKFIALVKSLLRQIRIAELQGNIRLVFDDPADAGFVYAVLGAVYPILRTTRLNRINIEPVLGEEGTIRGTARATVRLQPVRLVGPSLKFVFSRPALSAIKAAITG